MPTPPTHPPTVTRLSLVAVSGDKEAGPEWVLEPEEALQIEARRSAVKVSDVERTLKHKVDVQIPADTAAALSAVNVGKPVSEATPASGIVKALRPLVAALDAPDSVSAPGKAGKTASLFERLGRGLKMK